jgi:hypothetical protein
MLNAMDAVLELEDLERQLNSYAREHHLDLVYAPLQQDTQPDTSYAGAQEQLQYDSSPIRGAAVGWQHQHHQQQQQQEASVLLSQPAATTSRTAAGAMSSAGHQLELYGAVVRASTRQLLQALRDAKHDQRSLLQQRQQLAAAQAALQQELGRLQQAAAALPSSPANSPPRDSTPAGSTQHSNLSSQQQQQQQVAALLQQQAEAMHRLKKRFIKAHRQLIAQAAGVQQQLDGAAEAAELGRR